MTDPLSGVLSLLRFDSALSARLEVRGNYSFLFPESHRIVFGTCIEGSMYLFLDGSPTPVQLHAGDCYLLTRVHQYRIASSLEATKELSRQEVDAIRQREGIVRCGEGKISLVWAGGSFTLNDESGDLLLDLLPPVIHLPAGSVDRGPLRAVFDLINAETAEVQPGANAIAGSFANIVLVQILRVYLKNTLRPPGWLGAIADPQIGRALAAMHKDYARHWTVEDLASEVGMSRTAFAVRFRNLVGQPPLEYLTQWRMAVARNALKNGTSLSSVAGSVGYASDTAFNAAFKRATGRSPGRYRSMGHALGT
ncbi:AraC family transcriptional regulator [Tardiphaga sp.]|uniref:AraC family transcriptional regulator n=1 Tax=Tardiphaga sp. TaxID=1926292 RepID=UPI00262EB578|nr:AraC family transcriptional regulator [Tardiphaga sp.]MDB5620070.1 AraC family transcriptional regulator [Tardiphaga sp.]